MRSSRTSADAEIVLKAGRDAAIRRRRHPWVYSQAVGEVRGDPASGIVRVIGADGAVLGWGFHSSASLIAVRMISFGPGAPAEGWLRERMKAASALRRTFRLDSDAYRLVNAEGDFIPGLIVDVYADTAVVSVHVKGMESLLDSVESALAETLPDAKMYLKRDEHYSRREGLSLSSGYLRGDGDGTALITENGIRYLVDFARGQKTGFYLDQRRNRTVAAELASGRSVLNLFSYSGGFALAAARAGARHVVSVDSSAHALELGARNTSLNPEIDAGALEWVRNDAMEFLKNAPRSGLAIVDPPPFARRRSEKEGAVKGYLGLNQRVLTLAEPGGYVLSFSCSGAVSREDFRQLLSEAALRAGRRARFLRELGADVDHPVSTDHPEGEYLKGWLIHAE